MTTKNIDLDQILRERGEQYGPFATHAKIAQDIKRAMFGKSSPPDKLGDDQREALEMIAHKIARIINGNHNLVDSWDDIAGYATLVAKRLK